MYRVHAVVCVAKLFQRGQLFRGLVALADYYAITLDELVGRNLEQTSVADSETKQILEEMRDMEEHPEKYKSYRSFREGLNDVLGNTEY